jgi:LacI family transcriptional regulator
MFPKEGSSRNKSAITIADVARTAGVSTQTVSRVINGREDVLQETRERVQAVIDLLGYRPNRAARNLASARNPIIGLIISDITNPYYPEIVRGVESYALEHDYNVMLYNTDSKPERERQALTLMEEHRADGVIICAPRMDENELVHLLKQQRSTIVVNRVIAPEVAGVVRVDDRHGAMLATTHLVEAGYERLGYINTIRSPYSGPERFAGFRAVLEQHNIPLHDRQVLSCHPRVDEAFVIAKQLLHDNTGLQGIVCFNDLVAAGALRACHDDHIAVPDELAVVGFDGIPISALLIPSLTTVFVDRFALGQTAAQLLVNRLNGDMSQHEIVLQPQLVIRETSAARVSALAQSSQPKMKDVPPS